MTIDYALAIFIRSLTNLVWIFALALTAEIVLAVQEIEYNSAAFSAIRGIIAGAFWLVALIKILDLIDRRWDKVEETTKQFIETNS